MAKPDKDRGDVELNELFDRFDGRLVSPGGAAAHFNIEIAFGDHLLEAAVFDLKPF